MAPFPSQTVTEHKNQRLTSCTSFGWHHPPAERSVFQAADELERERRELAAYLTHEMLGETKRRVAG